MKHNILYDMQYQTTQSVNDCMNNILASPQEYYCEYGTPLWYKAEAVSPTSLQITFCGGQFRKIVRTRYSAEFISEPNHTTINMHFLGDLLGLPPMTLVADIDRFMRQKLCAVRAGDADAPGNRTNP